MEVIDQIVNREVVTDHFGYWPDFHDATIHRFCFATLPTGRYAITLQLTAFETTARVNHAGTYERAKQCLIEIELGGIREVEYADFSYQNVAFRIVFSEYKGGIQCEVSPSTGLYARIVAEEVVIVGLQ